MIQSKCPDTGLGIVTIPQVRFDHMLRRLQWLQALEAAGVESWVGYDSAYEYYKGTQ